MTSEECRVYLFNNYERIRNAIVRHYRTSTLFGISNKSYQKQRLEIFINLLDSYLLKHIRHYRIPTKTDSLFNLYADCVGSFKRNIYKKLFLYAERTFEHINHDNIEIVNMTDMLASCPLYDGRDPLDYILEKEASEQMEAQERDNEILDYYLSFRGYNKEFTKYLSFREEKMFLGMMGLKSYADVILEIKELDTYFTRDKLNALKYRVEYKLVCWYAYNDLIATEKLLKAFNLHPNYNKRFFHIAKLEELPDRMVCKDIAMGRQKFNTDINEPWEKHKVLEPYQLIRLVERFDRSAKQLHGNNGGFRFCSKKDHHGKYHSEYKTYINSCGICYDHVSKDTFSLPGLNEMDEEYSA